MADLTVDSINSILTSVVDKYTEQDIVSSNAINSIEFDGDKVNITVELNYPAKGYHDELTKQITDALAAKDINSVDVTIETKIVKYSTQKGVEILSEVKNIIAVASGKGGVGKSTTAVNLALALQAEGAKVAILDADIYGPSQPRMLGVSKLKPDTSAEGKLLPILGHGMQSMSIGYLVDEDNPMIWRGPMVTQALEQMLRDTLWRGIDYMIIDLPPGTGDTQLTLSQKIPVSGSVIVTTPQDIALLDARKGLKMFEKVNIPILGIIENMSLHICSKCGHEEAIFGTGGGEMMAKESAVNFLGALPLEMDIRTDVDEGTPTVAKNPEGRVAEIYKEISRKVSAKLTLQNRAMSSFPSIIIE
ncbi:Scaffold protein for [4Fe-4S] cluster assembly ApbC, MRP-like [Bathymodiolus heckerae thiotrophic gill symbiont]|uniref:iron-sulfur cluster carrier protein ApbC n=1 Tax=Bathymodiolus heckerae thiotrophic gill symbiont TaxID=1052212 RepID=UPI0010B4FCA0|nr:iron-sulfur cluster carrier protein ApbC [Bathymodiolus heckerae thiotrophic gill symbiont]CAC9962876.1 [4Fe-4S] cluster assembly scaffold protein Mrp (ApbC) [uncultured Gammaproteobacteria bacterium]SHN90946.1 Scaffold protein for [4Fe-4S] cluster assembly ApbC, MRP-like [Bathymodiolus heckerae thiotrophic gill symbiont]